MLDGVYKVIRKGKLEEYDRFVDIPQEFEYLIAFRPSVPPPPHTDLQHEWLEQLPALFQELVTRQTSK
jgi:hypothetical protein